ncbi:hypothetical protein ACHQM5_001113 [Ranunculus cassubicifolius]
MIDISSCLPYISVPPDNEFGSNPTDKCCRHFSLNFIDNNVLDHCLCILLRNPIILDLPVNTTRTSSLFTLCSASTTQSNKNLETLCPGPPSQSSPALHLPTSSSYLVSMLLYFLFQL